MRNAGIEIHMPQDVYIYDPNVPVPKSALRIEGILTRTDIQRLLLSDRSGPESIVIPDSVTKIGDDAFADCSGLQSITIPDSVTEIGDYAFNKCFALQSVTIPGSVTKIWNGAFCYCVSLKSVVIPDSVTEIGFGAFQHCSGLQSITIPDSVTKIKDDTFRACTHLRSIVIPDSVTEIGEDAFKECSGLQSVTIPDSVTKISGYAFSDCSGLQSVTIPDSVTEIGLGAFWKCSGLQSVTIPDNVTKIGDRAFQGCRLLQSVTIPDSVTEIGRYTFYDCSALQSVTIPDSVTKIGDRAFQGCRLLQSVTIPDSVTEIGNSAFWGCSALQSVTIQDSVTEIGNYAFSGCSDLQSVTIPDSVTALWDYAFQYCSGLQSITIPDGVTKIESGVFLNCSGLQSVTIPDTVTEIGTYAFSGCSELQSVTIPGSVKVMGESSFQGCSNLHTVMISDSVTEIGDYAFCRCSRLQSVTIPDSITIIGRNVFADCPALQSVMYKGVNIAPFINIDGYGTNTFNVIKALIEHQNPLSADMVRRSIDMAHRGRLAQWVADYPVFGEMRLSPAVKSVDGKTEEYLRRLFAAQKKTGCHVPKVLDKLAIAVCACGIPPERLTETFDVRYTEAVIRDGIPAVPAAACRCYYDRGTCDMLIQKDRISIMADAIALYNRSGHQECYKHLMDFILSHPDTKIEDLLYVVDHAEEIPMRAGTTLTQVRQHRTYMENLAEVEKIEAEYRKTVPGFKLSDYPCSIDPVSIAYDGMTARVLDLSGSKDIALAARLGSLTNCCQRLYAAGETAMMHGFLNPDAGFWVIEDKDGKVRAQAEIWKAGPDTLVFDNIEFADTDRRHISERTEQLRGVIAAWAIESGYRNIIMCCGYNELGTETMEEAPIPKLVLTPEEVFVLQEGNDADVHFQDIDEAHQYMQTEQYRPDYFVYTDTGRRCVYIKKNGIISEYLIKGYNRDHINAPHPERNGTTGLPEQCIAPR